MAGDTQITVVGNLTSDPEMRFTQSGAAVANFTVASTPRSYNKQTQQWEDGEALFLRCSVWRQLAENVAESLTKGMRVIVQGNLKQRSYQTKEGEKRTSYELDVQEVGPSLTFAKAHVQRNDRPERGSYALGEQQSQQGFGGQQSQGGFGGGQQQDPWSQSPAGFGGGEETPPF